MKLLRGMYHWFVRYYSNKTYRRPPKIRQSFHAKWFLSETPWEKSPDDLAGSLAALEIPSWTSVQNPYMKLSRSNMRRLALRHKKLMALVEKGEINGTHQDFTKLSDDMAQLIS